MSRRQLVLWPWRATGLPQGLAAFVVGSAAVAAWTSIDTAPAGDAVDEHRRPRMALADSTIWQRVRPATGRLSDTGLVVLATAPRIAADPLIARVQAAWTDATAGRATGRAVLHLDMAPPRYSSREDVRRVRFLLPEVTDGRTCVIHLAIVPAGGVADRLPSWPGLTDQPRQLLGPCGFVGAFGPAGGALRQQLQTSRYRPAAVAPHWLDAVDRPPPADPLTRDVALRRASEELLRCAAHREGCHALLGAPASPLVPDHGVELTSAAVGWHPAADPSRAAAAFTSLCRELGHATCRSVWRGEQELSVATQARLGRSLGDWLARWVGMHHLAWEAQSPLPRRAGVTVTLLLAAMSALVVRAARRGPSGPVG
jgi:hypothetical protein